MSKNLHIESLIIYIKYLLKSRTTCECNIFEYVNILIKLFACLNFELVFVFNQAALGFVSLFVFIFLAFVGLIINHPEGSWLSRVLLLMKIPMTVGLQFITDLAKYR